MPLFIDESTHTIAQRKHEINTEVLNGDLSSIDKYHDCFILKHTPNKKLGYDVYVIDEVNPQEGFDKVNNLGREKTSEKGQPFYDLVPVERLNKYISLREEYTLKLSEEKTKNENKQSTAIENKQPVLIGSRKPETEKIENGTKKTRYKVTLVRDVNNEKPIDISK